MIFNWEKKGLIFNTSGQYKWMHSHTTPIAALVLHDRIRIYITTRSQQDGNKNFVSYTSFVDLSKSNPSEVIYLHSRPIFELGRPGKFDEFGIMVAKPVVYDNKVYLYYMGWQRLVGLTAPYQVMLGLGISEDQGFSFRKISEGPVMGIDYFDQISIGNVSLMIEEDVWKMWYTSFTRWDLTGVKPTPIYNIKYAESKDGIFWKKKNIVAIKEQQNFGVATPSVIKLQNKYHMWFGYRKAYDEKGAIGPYKIGYANSDDGINWNRNDDNSGISVSDIGWDSQMICYPHVVKVDGSLIMFYCGNEFGKSGFGYATVDLNYDSTK